MSDTAPEALLRKPDAPPPPELKKPDEGALVVLKNPGLCCQLKPLVKGPILPEPEMSTGSEMTVSIWVSGMSTSEPTVMGPTCWVRTGIVIEMGSTHPTKGM